MHILGAKCMSTSTFQIIANFQNGMIRLRNWRLIWMVTHLVVALLFSTVGSEKHPACFKPNQLYVSCLHIFYLPYIPEESKQDVHQISIEKHDLIIQVSGLMEIIESLSEESFCSLKQVLKMRRKLRSFF
jgi:hypothetical protein